MMSGAVHKCTLFLHSCQLGLLLVTNAGGRREPACVMCALQVDQPASCPALRLQQQHLLQCLLHAIAVVWATHAHNALCFVAGSSTQDVVEGIIGHSTMLSRVLGHQEAGSGGSISVGVGNVYYWYHRM